jgi:hypothetical protein
MATVATNRDVFHQTVAGWIADCYQPGGYYAARMQACALDIFNRSPELTMLKNSRLLRMNAALRYFLQAISLLVGHGIPLATAAAGGWGGWWLLQERELQELQEFAAANSPVGNQTAAAANQTAVASAAAAETGWLQTLTASLPSPVAAGSWLGDQVNTILGFGYSVTSEFVNHSLAIGRNWSFLQQSFLQATVPLLLAVVAYGLGVLLARFLQNLFVLLQKEQQLQQTQQMFLQESTALIERTLTERVRPPLLQRLHHLLSDSAAGAAGVASQQTQQTQQTQQPSLESLLVTYAPTYELLRHAIYDCFLGDLKTVEFAQLMVKNRATARYFNGLYYLMRNAEEDIARTLFSFYQEIALIEGDPVSLLMEKGQQRLQALTAT